MVSKLNPSFTHSFSLCHLSSPPRRWRAMNYPSSSGRSHTIWVGPVFICGPVGMSLSLERAPLLWAARCVFIKYSMGVVWGEAHSTCQTMRVYTQTSLLQSSKSLFRTPSSDLVSTMKCHKLAPDSGRRGRTAGWR